MEIENKTVQQAVQEFYDVNQFGDDGGINEKYAWIKFGFIKIPIPNTESRKNNVLFHDINHLITNNDTSWKGESAVSAFEIASGGWKNFYFLWAITLWAMGLGVAFYFNSTKKSFFEGLKMKNALTFEVSQEEILKFKVSDLQKQVVQEIVITKSFTFWSILSFLVFSTPFFLGILLVVSILKII